MPNGYPCPACGDLNAPLFVKAGLTDESDSSHDAYSAVYACEPCIDAAKIVKGELFVAPSIDLTSVDRP